MAKAKLKARESIRRAFPICEIRAVGEGDGMKIGGYAAVFNSLSEPIMFFREIIQPGAFKKTLKEHDVRAFWSHDSSKPLGRTGNETLTLSEDKRGLPFELILPPTTSGRDAFESIKRGDVDGMSFGFQVIKESWEELPKERQLDLGVEAIRTLDEVRLLEISPVSFPAYEASTAEVRMAWDDYQLAVNPGEARVYTRNDPEENTTRKPVKSDHSQAGSSWEEAAKHREQQIKRMERQSWISQKRLSY